MDNTNEKIKKLLIGGDLRSIGQSGKIEKLINNQEDFDILFNFINNSDRLIVMRTVDVIEKITRKRKDYLVKHKNTIIELCFKAKDKELKWHLAQIVMRLKLTKEEIREVFNILKSWLLDKNESKIVRANSLESLFEISKSDITLKEEFYKIISQIKKEDLPSLNARIKKILM